MRGFLWVACFLTCLQMAGQSQPADSSTTSASKTHSPRKATLYSAVLPGAGQVYNKKFWKVPIVYAGLGTAAYFVQTNNKSYQRYRKALVATLDDDPNTINDTGYSSSQLDEFQEFYHRWRDISIMAMAGVYVLQIIDAHVDAHLFYFDVSEDISLSIHPSLPISAHNKGGISLVLKF